MSRKRSPLQHFEQITYLMSRGDINIAQRGPGVLTKPLVRRKATRPILGPIMRGLLH